MDKVQYKVDTAVLGTLKNYHFVVVFARYNNQWLYCRAKDRDTYETAGGHIEKGETPLEAAKRELYEETGALSFDIEAAFDYSTYRPGAFYQGQVFYAKIHELGSIPDFEMAEVRQFDAIPDKMRFPQILPVLYKSLQGWLNLQSAKDELWDVYDSERKLSGRTHRRGDPLPAGDFHLVVHVWIMNKRGEFLISKRSPNKGFPNMWECTGGSAVTGDDSLGAAIREAGEELGVVLDPENGQLIGSLKRNFDGHGDFIDVWLFREDIDISAVVLQPGETCDVMWADKHKISRMMDEGTFLGREFFFYLDELFNLEK